MSLPDDFTPRDALEELDELEARLERAHLWHASREIDGEAATIRRACDVALGEGPPVLLELGPGEVLELDPNHHQEDQP